MDENFDKKQKVEKEAQQKVAVIRKEKVEKKKEAAKVEQKPKILPKLNDRVRMFDGKAVGTIDVIEKGKATVNYGMFTTNVNLDLLEVVERSKK